MTSKNQGRTKKELERRREKTSYYRLWYRLRPSFAPKERRFYSEREKRAYEAYLRKIHARAAYSIPV
jgi:hypothetical protein